MPLGSNDLGALIGTPAPQREVVQGVWVSDADTDYTLLHTGNDELRVNVTKAEGNGGHNTALGKALSWLKAKRDEGETVVITGPDAEAITSHL